MTGPTLQAGPAQALHLSIEHDGSPVNDLELLMGAKGHLVILSEGAHDYVHVHPEEATDGVLMNAHFPHLGLYRAFFQFKRGGSVHLAPFTLRVAAGPANHTVETHHGHHGHAGGHH